jgi:serine/threonine protein kinase
VHRDLKLENVLITPGNEVRVIDFGLSCNLSESRSLEICGSPGYLAPEMLAGYSYDTKVDYFSLGVILFMLLSGRQPF